MVTLFDFELIIEFQETELQACYENFWLNVEHFAFVGDLICLVACLPKRSRPSYVKFETKNGLSYVL